MTTYVQRRDENGLETVDEFESRKEARTMLQEYRLADRSAEYYLSQRPCNAWREAGQYVDRRIREIKIRTEANR